MTKKILNLLQKNVGYFSGLLIITLNYLKPAFDKPLEYEFSMFYGKLLAFLLTLGVSVRQKQRDNR